MANRAALLFHTIRPLRPVQIYGRLLKRLQGSPADRRPSPPPRPVTGMWASPVPRPRSLFDGWRVRFLNHDGEIAQPEQWHDPGQAKLWLYNLHYFDDLAAPADPNYRAQQRRLIDRWIAENPPALGNGWEPYPTSLRICNWIKFCLAGETLAPGWCDSLAVQARWLAGHLEWHLLGNHLLANAKAMVLAGLFFEGEEAEAWLRTGLAIYARELPEQVLDDGGHFELSPMYHSIILEDLLDLMNAARAYGRTEPLFAALPGITAGMRKWLAAMTHPDGELALFNDAAFGIAATSAELEAYARRLDQIASEEGSRRLRHLQSSGYVRVDCGDAAAFLDIAEVGPSYLPGHAHADTLSFELSLGTERVIVNGGTSTYERGPLRQAQRGTRAHSTVEVGGQDSSEVWASFRVARRARVERVSVADTEAGVSVSAAHTGYQRLPGKPTHQRNWTMRDGALEIHDEVTDLGSLPAVARFHLAPGITVNNDRLITPSGRALRWSASGPATVEPSVWYSRFGHAEAAITLVVPLVGGRQRTTLEWS